MIVKIVIKQEALLHLTFHDLGLLSLYRLFVIFYDRHHQKPSDKVIESLKNICADKRNMVYIVTELSIDFMDEWFADVPGLGLICENGYLHKVI